MHQARIKRLQNKLGTLNAVAIVDPMNLSYFCGEPIESGLLIVKKRSAHLYIRKLLLSQYAHLNPKELKTSLKVDGKIGFVDHALTYLQYRALKKLGSIRKSDIVDQVRAVKEKNELKLLKESAELVSQAMKHISAWIAPGMSEIEVANEIERYGKAHGASGVSFEPIVASGEASAHPHYRASTKKLAKNSWVKLDFGYCLHGYCSDMTRVIGIGKMPSRIEEMYALVKHASHSVYKACRHDVSLEELDQVAKKALGKEAKHFIHFLGHGIGLQVHEPPSFSKKGKVEEGMVLAIEPGLYIPGVGGVRYENMVEIKRDGCNVMTHLDI